jgi:signal transduction histidine kinase
VNNSVGATRSLLQSSLAYGGTLTGVQREEFEQAMGIATARLERLNSFMRSFADVVRMPPPRLQPCDVGSLVDGCVRLMQAQTDPARITWTWDRQTPIGNVAIDPAQMEQALINILKNAVEAVGERGSVCVRLGSASERPFIEVEDSGPGVPESARAMLFTPFFTTKPDGQGIGLTMVQEILRKHGFEYALDGPEGGPTRFRVLL